MNATIGLRSFHYRKLIKRWRMMLYLALALACGLKIAYITKRDSKIDTDLIWILNNRNATPLLEGSHFKGKKLECSKEQKIIIGVISSSGNRLARDAIRQSWAADLPKWKTIFFLGETGDQALQEELERESIQHEDLIQANFQDSYKNLTIKVLLMFKWASQYCPSAQYLLKVDDDVYLNTQEMKKLLQCLNSTMQDMYSTEEQEECNAWNIKNIIGYYLTSSNKYVSYVAGGYLYKNIYPDQDPSSKWFLDSRLYPYKVIQNSLSGTSYLLSANLLPEILIQSRYHSLINLEDIYITNIILDKALNIKLSHIEGWNNFRPQWDNACLYKKILTSHGLEPNELLSINTKMKMLNPNNCGLFENIKAKIIQIISYYIPRIH